MGHDGYAVSIAELLDERRHLLDVAAWMLGTGPEAEDAVTGAYQRWYDLSDAQRTSIDEPRTWLTRATGTICLDRLPLRAFPGEAATEADLALTEEISDVLIDALNTLSPAERAVFVHAADVDSGLGVNASGLPPRPVADVAGQVAGRWAGQVVGQGPGQGSPWQHERIVRAVRRACDTLDAARLASLLAPDAGAFFDGGGKVRALPRPVHGRRQVGRALLALLAPRPHITLQLRPANGRTAIVVCHHDQVVAVISFGVTRHRVTRVWAVLNPDKLRSWNRGTAPAAERGAHDA
ncbi:RNA polymerase subunit sigma [Streptomyces sp. NPDC090106]|uniref:RNA polymerase subunit sigma n=1 Tax=Streptomyces sp. NPDC090106 TaxID=3365946 RepID=UPI0038098698